MIAAAIAGAIAIPFAAGVFDRVEPFDISDPGSEVEQAYGAFAEATGVRAEAEVLLVVEPAAGARSASGRTRVAAAARRLKRVQGVARVATAADRPDLISADGEAALLVGLLEAGEGRVETGERVVEAFAGDRRILAGGIAVAAHQIGEQTEEDTRKIELFAAPILLLLLLWAFRSLVAALLPLALGGFAIVLTFASLNGISRAVDIDLFSLQVVTGLGVGLAIDYSLFVIARFRGEVRRGASYQAAQRTALATAGRTIAFSAMTVALALAGLVLFPQQFLSSTGIAGAIVALLSGATALLVLPAILALLGPRIDPGWAGAESVSRPDPLSAPTRFWRTLPRRVMASPVPVATLALLVMLAIAAPGLGGKLTTPDARVLPEENSARQVADTVATRFPDVAPTQLLVLAPPDASGAELRPAIDRLTSRPDVAEVSDPRALGEAGTHLIFTSPLDPLSDAAQDLVAEVRAAGWPEPTLVGGRAAELTDQRESIGSSAPPVIAFIVITNLLLVMVMMRSLVLPLVSLLLNVLTVAAAYGIMVAIFRTEGPAELLGTVAQEGIDISVPILAFAVVFGLSTDYGIFLFSRIAEARSRGLGDREAVVEGIARTGRLITLSALIFSVAVGAFVFSDLVIVKEFAVAVAIAVLLDATVIRGLLVPAILQLLGARAWAWPSTGVRRAATDTAP